MSNEIRALYSKDTIRALYSKDTIRVYQAYNKIIASEAVMKGTFGNNFKNPLNYRSLQLGLRGEFTLLFVIGI